MARFVLPQAEGKAAEMYLISPRGFWTVSYTHLDVYKRQASQSFTRKGYAASVRRQSRQRPPRRPQTRNKLESVFPAACTPEKHFSLRTCRSRPTGGKAQSGTHLSQKRGTQLSAASLFFEYLLHSREVEHDTDHRGDSDKDDRVQVLGLFDVAREDEQHQRKDCLLYTSYRSA